MNVSEKFLKYLCCALLAGASANTLAVSLGSMRGAAIVGQSFDVTLVAQRIGDQGLSAVCVDAQVFFGDNPIPPNRVSTVIAAGANAAGETLIRIRTSSVVDEPVVTVLVHEGCSQKNTRRYVFLAEVKTDSARQAPTVSGEVVKSAPLAVQLAATGDAGSKAGRLAGATRPEDTAMVPRKKASIAKTRPAPAADNQRAGSVSPRVVLPSAQLADKSAQQPASKSSSSRLKLDPLEPAAERDPVLRSASELLASSSADGPQRAAAASLSQSLVAEPQDMQRDSQSQRLKSLETDMANMLAQSRVTEKSVAELQWRLEQSRSERYNNWLVYTLGALLLLASLVAIFFWTRSRQPAGEPGLSPWWRKGTDVDDKKAAPGALPDDLKSAVAPLKTTPVMGSKPSKFELDFDLDGDDAVANKRKSGSTLQPIKYFKSMEAKDCSDFSISLPSITGMPRIVNAEELFDVQQRADFFVSLGDFDKAIEVLRQHIADNVETSALAYLDLFELYHSLGRKADYEVLSKDFSRTFNAQVPVFDEYTTDTHGLEFYATARARIESTWPTPKVLDVIEESIFRKPDSRHEVFSLAAYRELLLLHSIAKRVVDRTPGRKNPELKVSTKTSPPGIFRTNAQPLSAEAKDLPALPTLLGQGPDLTRPPISDRLGLDVDLSLDFDDLQPALPGDQTRAGEASPDFSHELIDFDLPPAEGDPR